MRINWMDMQVAKFRCKIAMLLGRQMLIPEK
ncbi:hypothetical protein L284_14955 [Novosphingobium lindaniclasticum LE124]|uniref:Uncharacterized protein n=1 Tax=Novosphingobium lindaniclasticum LE124 TaxID=1096930 RepID=T0HIS8_9SPHN|nr:hypothetical protein L284_14955 [Novosphingobium lindaniclasticum LE124]